LTPISSPYSGVCLASLARLFLFHSTLFPILFSSKVPSLNNYPFVSKLQFRFFPGPPPPSFLDPLSIPVAVFRFSLSVCRSTPFYLWGPSPMAALRHPQWAPSPSFLLTANETAFIVRPHYRNPHSFSRPPVTLPLPADSSPIIFSVIRAPRFFSSEFSPCDTPGLRFTCVTKLVLSPSTSCDSLP